VYVQIILKKLENSQKKSKVFSRIKKKLVFDFLRLILDKSSFEGEKKNSLKKQIQ